ncbi:pilus assembly protein CpaB [Loktanella ponticola]|uniref:Pilus assembly protein CpaB n=1 Tax=Yoonia ponticola TaxID=1524255 RepID=A0A7W9BLC5_9RHOB|nr:Flp pilus assembly protein CpaB [Yoonia ponticola]MBB5722476.1 pilus assembly protein CpaB [Yoonia ponticola]
MRSVFGLVLIIGMGLAGFAVYMVNGYVSQTQNERDLLLQRATAATPTVAVYAVNRPMKYGETLTADDVQLIQYAEPHLPEGVFRTEEALFPEGDEELRVVTRPMEINEPVLAVKVTSPGEIAGITSLLSPGMRAFAISVDVQSGVSGFLRPGDRVDVYWSGNMRTAGGNNENITQLILTSVELIAIDQTADNNRSDAAIARTVTVQVTPAHVAALTQASATGKLSLSLVGAGDTETLAAIAMDQRTLLGVEEAPEVVVEAPAVVEAPKQCFIKQRSGAQVVEVEIPCTN